MKVGCGDKNKVFKTSEASTKSWFRVNGLIDKYLNILDLKGFRKNNTKWSNYAKSKYGVEGRLFSEDNNGTKAVPNTEMFKKLDEAKGIFYQTENSIKPGVPELFESNPELSLIGTQQQYSQYLDTIFPSEQIHILGSKQDTEGFKDFVENKNFAISEDIIPTNLEQVQYKLKSVDILLSDKAKQIFAKGEKAKWDLNKILTELAVPKEQKQLLLDLGIKDREQLALELASKYGYTVEINTAKENAATFNKVQGYDTTKVDIHSLRIEESDWGNSYIIVDKDGNHLTPLKYTKEEAEEILAGIGKINTQYYSNLSAPGGTGRNKYEGNPDWEYQELEFKTPLITPSIKGHAQFATEQGIGWARVWYNKKTGTVEIQEIQSDLFQKGRYQSVVVPNKTELKNVGDEVLSYKEFVKVNKLDPTIPHYEEWDNYTENKTIKYETVILEDNSSKNQFLQLLNKDNNWVTFFIKSIIQDTAKQTITEVQESDVEAKVRELEKEELLEIDCKGKIKAEDGITTLFDKGGKWEIVTDFKNAPTHKSGGKDISIQGKKVEVEKNELRIENDFGDVAVIPSKYKIEVQDAIKSNCHSCIDGIVESLPKMKDYAGDGTVFPFFGRYKRFKNSLPDNLKNTPEDEYAMRYYWKHSNKPKSFDEAINREQPMFTMEDDGYYHAPSVEPNTLRFLKPKTHPTLQYELDWYNSDNPEAVDFRNKYDLDTSGKFYKYVPKKL